MDGTFVSLVNRHKVLLDIVDEAWLADALSDDDVDIPLEHIQPVDVDDTNVDDEGAQQQPDKDTWQELALGQFLEPDQPEYHANENEN